MTDSNEKLFIDIFKFTEEQQEIFIQEIKLSKVFCNLIQTILIKYPILENLNKLNFMDTFLSIQELFDTKLYAFFQGLILKVQNNLTTQKETKIISNINDLIAKKVKF